MFKYIVIPLIMFVAYSTIAYLLGAFIEASFDIQAWQFDTRNATAVTMIIMYMLSVAIYLTSVVELDRPKS